MTDSHTDFLVVGAGITGLAFARYATETVPAKQIDVFEREATIGGYCRTIVRDGFVWDYSGHFFHFRHPEIEAELRLAQLLEDAPIPLDKAAPGNVVHYTERESGNKKRAVLVGPWDAEDYEDAVSYRSPLAAGMLGLKAGHEAEIELPSGSLSVRIDSIESLGL